VVSTQLISTSVKSGIAQAFLTLRYTALSCRFAFDLLSGLRDSGRPVILFTTLKPLVRILRRPTVDTLVDRLISNGISISEVV